MFFKIENHKGFTLVELMIVMAIIGILAAIAVPNFIAYRKRGHIGSCVTSAESIRSALASYAVDSRSNGYPRTADGPDWESFVSLCNLHGTSLKKKLMDQGFSFFAYHGVDKDGNLDTCTNEPGEECSDYLIVFEVLGINHDMIGSRIIVSSPGIFRQSW